MRIHAIEVSPLISVSIASDNNRMADAASCTFHHNTANTATFTVSDNKFLHTFATTFPLQNASWCGFHLSNKLASRVFLELRGEASTLELWW